MKKLLTILALIASLTLLVLTGCSADTFTEKSFLADTAECVNIEVYDREIEISASTDGKVHIDYFDGEKEFLKISDENGTLNIELQTDKNWTDFVGVKPSKEYRKINIRLPKSVATLTVSTTNESISIKELEFANEVTLSDNGGNINFEKMSVGAALNLTVKNGNINGAVAGGWDNFSISCAIKKGYSNLPANKPDGAKKLSVNCNNGDVNIEFKAVGQR